MKQLNHSIRRQHHFNQLTRIQFSPKSLKIWEKKTRFAHCSRCISRTYILFYFFLYHRLRSKLHQEMRKKLESEQCSCIERLIQLNREIKMPHITHIDTCSSYFFSSSSSSFKLWFVANEICSRGPNYSKYDNVCVCWI